jgi:hypothetical protein
LGQELQKIQNERDIQPDLSKIIKKWWSFAVIDENLVFIVTLLLSYSSVELH